MCKEFRYLFRVNAENPEIAVKALGFAVTGDPKSFRGIETSFVKNQDFITAVPIDIALSVPERAHIIYRYPDCQFIVTGVPAQRVANLADFGYKAYALSNEKELESFFKHFHQCEEGVAEDETVTAEEEVVEENMPEKKEASDELCTCSKENAPEKIEADRYYLDGKEVSKEEWEKEWSKAEKDLKEAFKDFSKEALYWWDF